VLSDSSLIFERNALLPSSGSKSKPDNLQELDSKHNLAF
jgi:hypothetical protein